MHKKGLFFNVVLEYGLRFNFNLFLYFFQRLLNPQEVAMEDKMIILVALIYPSEIYRQQDSIAGTN